MDINNIISIDVVKYANYVLNEYKTMYQYSTGVHTQYIEILNNLIKKGNERRLRLLEKFPDITDRNDFTNEETRIKQDIEKDIQRITKAKYLLLETGVKNEQLKQIEYYYIESGLQRIIGGTDNDKIESFERRLGSTALNKNNFIKIELEQALKEEIEYLQTLYEGRLPMFLDKFDVLCCFISNLEQIQLLQYLHKLNKQLEESPQSEIIQAKAPNKLTQKQIALLFHELFKKGIFNKYKIHQDSTKQIQFIAELMGVKLSGIILNTNLYRYWLSIQSEIDNENVNNDENKKVISKLLDLIEKQ